jgi:DnaA family protein
LPLRLQTHTRFETFVRGHNEAAVAHLQELRSTELIWLWGGASAGKSHLLQAACAAAHAAGRRTMYVPLAAADLAPQVLAGLESLDLVALDDVHAVAGDRAWDLGLFALLESARTGATSLLMAARTTPQACGFSLPDLTSRASAAAIYRLAMLEDAERMVALKGHARHRGLDLEESAARYLLRHARRDMAELCRCLDVLDRQSLAAQRRLTVPFIRQVLNGQDG